MKLKEMLGTMAGEFNARIIVDGCYIVDYIDVTHRDCGDYEDCEVIEVKDSGAYTDIEVDTNTRIEIWHDEDGDDWAQLSIAKDTDTVTSIMTGYWDWSGEMTRDEAIAFIGEEGYTDFDDWYDSYTSWEQYNDCVSAGGAYGIL